MAVGRRTIKDIPVIGTAIKAGTKIVSVIIGKVSEIVSRIKEIVNKLFDDIAKAIDRITGKGFTIAKDFTVGLKDVIINTLEGAVKCVIANIKSLITCLVVVVNIVVQAVIGIVAALGYLVGMAIGIAPQDNTFSASVEGWRDNTTNFFKWLAPDKDVFNTVQWVGDMLLSCVPIVGDGRDIVEFITGVDMVTGEKLTLTERILTGIFMLLPIVGAKAGREIVTGIFKQADDLLPIIGKKMDELLDGISTMFNKGDEFELAGVPNGSMPTEASTKVQDFISKITGKDKDINISSGSGSKVDDITETSYVKSSNISPNKGLINPKLEEIKTLVKNGEVKGKNIISQIDDETQVVFRNDTGVNAHPVKPKGYIDPIDHYNIEIQTKTPAGKWKSKWSYHIVFDEQGNIINTFD